MPRRWSAIGAAAVLVGTLTGCSAFDGFVDGLSEDPPRDDSGKITAAATAAPTAVQEGDCIESVPTGTFTNLSVIPCDQEHRGEIFAETALDDGTFPGKENVTDEASSFCRTEFETFVGMDYDESVIDFIALYPTAESWERNDRAIQCVLDANEPVTGTLKNADR